MRLTGSPPVGFLALLAVALLPSFARASLRPGAPGATVSPSVPGSGAPPAVGRAGDDVRVLAVRTATPPRIDGRLDDPAWQRAPPASTFTQIFPAEDTLPTERTEVRVLYDDDNLYVGVRCFDRTPSGIVSRLSRRDDFGVDADFVSVAIDSRLDRKDAFVFQAYASGLLADALRYDDTSFDPSWDQVWNAATSVDAAGWSVEFLIPLRVLRFRRAGTQVWGFQVKRYIQRRDETDDLAYIPRAASAEVSRYGLLAGIQGIRPPRDVELVPFTVARESLRSNLAAADPRLRSEPQATAGLDAKVGLTSNLTLDLAVNPDFGEVEADQVVLNLSTFETYYPEKRPFFLEGVDLFALPIQVFYSRRVGAPPDGPPLADGGQIVTEPPVTMILGAAKVSGRLTPTLAVAALDAVTAGEEALVEAPSGPGTPGAGSDELRRAAIPANFGIVRVRRELAHDSSVGFAGTTVTHLFDHPDRFGCPADGPVGADGRCTHDAYVGSLDLTLKSPLEDYALAAQVAGSRRVGGPPALLPDGTTLGAGASGLAASLSAHKQGGEHWLGGIDWQGYSPRFDDNDAGYNRLANYHRFLEQLEWRTLQPGRFTMEKWLQLAALQQLDWGGRPLSGNGLQLSQWERFGNFWSLYGELDLWTHGWDDRETRDGSFYERPHGVGLSLNLSTDSRKRVVLDVGDWTGTTNAGVTGNAWLDLVLHASPRLDLGVSPTASYLDGDLRWVATQAGAGGGREYTFGFQRAASVGVTVRGTYTFTPRLTLQLYSQLFLATVAYRDFLAFDAPPAGAVDVPLSALRPTVYAGNPDLEEKDLNVNVVLRWEYALGSELFLVYTRAQTAMPYAPIAGPLFPAPTLSPAQLWRGPATDTFLLKLSYFWG